MEFTAVYITIPDGSIAAHVEEFPNVITRGRTIEEARGKAAAAVRMLLGMERTEYAAETKRQAMIRETVTIEDDGAMRRRWSDGNSGCATPWDKPARNTPRSPATPT